MLCKTVQQYKYQITALQETRWRGKGAMDTTLFYSGKEKGTHEAGVAILVDKKMKQKILDFKPINENIRIKTRFFNLYMINVYGPTEENDELTKDYFYQVLEKTNNAAPGNYIKMVFRDFNAKLGREEEYQDVTGKHSLHHVTNDNGNRMIDFEISKNMIISSTCFPHKAIHKGTWPTPDGRTTNQIDHVMISKRGASSIIDVRTYRGADCGSDHFLMGIKYRCKVMSKIQTYMTERKRLDIPKLENEETCKVYQD
jgi:exonuclease III